MTLAMSAPNCKAASLHSASLVTVAKCPPLASASALACVHVKFPAMNWYRGATAGAFTVTAAAALVTLP